MPWTLNRTPTFTGFALFCQQRSNSTESGIVRLRSYQGWGDNTSKSCAALFTEFLAAKNLFRTKPISRHEVVESLCKCRGFLLLQHEDSEGTNFPGEIGSGLFPKEGNVQGDPNIPGLSQQPFCRSIFLLMDLVCKPHTICLNLSGCRFCRPALTTKGAHW